jgi:hypothetical protein
MDNKMNFNAHINETINKALKLLGFILRISKPFRSPDVLKVLYFSYVRSLVEYASVVWNPQYVTYINRLEAVQKRFRKHVTFKTYCYDLSNSTSTAATFMVPSLESRRSLSDQYFLFKIINGFVDSPNLLERVGFHCPTRFTRNQTLYHISRSGSNYAQNSFIRRSCLNYNMYFSTVDPFNNSPVSFKHAISKILYK